MKDPPIPLAGFLPSLPRLRVHPERVDLRLEVTRKLLAEPGKTLWFQGFAPITLVGNLWPSREAIAEYFGIGTGDIPHLLLSAMERPLPPRVVTEGATWRARQGHLTDLPVPQFYPHDAGTYLTASIFSALWDGKRNLSYHRFWVQGPGGGPARIVPRHLDRMIGEARKEHKDLPVAIVVGAPLEVLLAAACSVDYALDEMEIASSLHEHRTGTPLPVVELPNGIHVPQQAEIVLEGAVTQEDREEGPFLDILSTYDTKRLQPVIRVDSVHTVEAPVLHAILPASDEHFLLMGLPREPLLWRAVRSVVPGVTAVRLTEGGAGWLHGVVAIDKRREGDGKNALLAAFSGHASMKHVIVVDSDVDIFNDREVEWAVATRFQADRGLVVIPGATGSSLDPSATKDGVTTKWGMDATLPLGTPRAPFLRERYPAGTPVAPPPAVSHGPGMGT